MKKILFILFVLITSLSFAGPKDWVDENKLRKAGYEFYPGTPKYSHYPIVFKKVLDNGDVLCINILDHRRYETDGFDGAYLDETMKILDEILGVEEGGEGKKVLENAGAIATAIITTLFTSCNAENFPSTISAFPICVIP